MDREQNNKDNLDYFHKAMMHDLAIGKISADEYCVVSTRIQGLLEKTKSITNNTLGTIHK